VDHPAEETLAQLAEGSLDGQVAADVHRHVRGCSSCRTALAALAPASSPDPSTLDFSVPATMPRRLEPGQLVGRFEIVRLLGEGGMGAVYAARDPELGREVAVKIMRLASRGADDTEGRRARLRREAQAMARLAHPNVVPVFEVGELDDGLFVVMELVEGGTVTRWLRAAPHGRDAIVDVFLAAGRGLAAAHAAGIIHRDFKPDNVLVGQDGRVRVTDFGLARPVFEFEPAPDAATNAEDTLTPMGAVVGTPAYMAPEQMRGEPIDARADLFAFCTAFWEALHGQRPFEGKTLAELGLRIAAGSIAEPPPDRRAPRWLRRELSRGLRVSPSARHDSMADLLAALEAGRARSARRRALLPAAVAVGAALTLAAGILALRWQRPPARRSVAVLAPRNASERREATWLSPALGEMLASELGGDPRLRLVSPESVARASADLGLAGTVSAERLQKLQAQVGADVVVGGSYLSAGPQIRLDLRLWDARTGETLATLGESGDELRLVELVSRAGSGLRRALGGSAKPVGAQPSFPADAEAARFYARGLELTRSFDAQGAVEQLQRAAQLAPDNARILLALTRALSMLGRPAEAREAAARTQAASAGLGRVDRLRLDLALRIANEDWKRAAEAAAEIYKLLPDDLEVGLELARMQAFAHQQAASIATIEALRRQHPAARNDARLDLAEARAFDRIGDYARLLAAAERAGAKASAAGARWSLADATYWRATGLRGLGDRQRALASFDECGRRFREVGDRSRSASCATMRATVLADGGDLDAARVHFEEALSTYKDLGHRQNAAVMLHNLAILLRRGRDLPAALETAGQAHASFLEMGERAAASNSLTVAAHIRKDLGDLAGARAAIEESIVIRRAMQHKLLASSLTQLADLRVLQGDLDGAQKLCGEAAAVTNPTDKLQTTRGRACIGAVQLARGEHAAAEASMRAVAESYEKMGNADDVALALAMRARALLAQGRDAEAAAAVKTATGFVRSALAKGTVGIVAALVEPDPLRVLPALRLALAEAERVGVAEDQLDARLAIGVLERRANARGARSALRALALDARARGFLVLAGQAERAAR